MSELTINDTRYRTGRLNAFEQFHVMRRLAPLLSGLGESLAKLPTLPPNAAANGHAEGNAADEAQNPSGQNLSDITDEQLWSAIGPIAEVLAGMSDADTEYVLKHCMAKTTRFNGERWVPIFTQGQLIFEDVDMAVMMQITIETIRENLSNFFPVPPARDSSAAVK